MVLTRSTSAAGANKASHVSSVNQQKMSYRGLKENNLRYLDTFALTEILQANMTWRSTHESTRETNRTNVVFVARNLSRWGQYEG